MILPHNPLQISVLYKNNSDITLTICPSRGLQVRGIFYFRLFLLKNNLKLAYFLSISFLGVVRGLFSLTFNNHPGFRQAVPFVLCAKRLCQVSAIRSNQGPYFWDFVQIGERTFGQIVSGPRQTDSIGLCQSAFSRLVWVICKHV